MQEEKNTHNVDTDTINLLTIAHFIKESYKIIALSIFCSLIGAFTFTYAFGQYTASLTLRNYAEIDIPQIKYLQAALPSLSQQESVGGSKSYLSDDKFWSSAVKIKSLFGKSDFKDMLDPASLKSSLFNLYSIQVIGKAATKESAEERAKETANYFISGATFINLRDLIRKYEVQSAATSSKLTAKILDAEVELAFIDRRIKSLNELKKQYPSSAIGQNSILQFNNDDNDSSGVKYLPILTQLVAANIDQEKQKELLLRYQEETAKIRIYDSFLKKVKPFLGAGNDPRLTQHLLDIISQVSKEANTNHEKVTLGEIEGDLKKIMAFQLYGLPQMGAISTTGPAYFKKAALSILGGALIGILFALGLIMAQRLRVALNSAEQ